MAPNASYELIFNSKQKARMNFLTEKAKVIKKSTKK